MALHVEIVQSFESIHAEWESLLSVATTNKVFLHPVYQQTWWETMGRGELHIVVIRSGSEVVGIAPFFIHEKHLGFVGCKDVTDYLDVIVHPDYSTQIYQHVGQHLAELVKQCLVSDIELCSIPSNSPTIATFPDILRQQLPTADVIVTQQDVCPQIALPASFEEYLASLDRKQRHEIRRKQRRLTQEAGFRIEVVETIDHRFNPVEHFIYLHQLSSPEKHDFWSDQHRLFFETLLPRFAEQGWLKLFYLHLDRWLDNSLDLPLPTKPIAAMLVFDYDNIYNLYNSGYDPQYRQLSTGQILTTLTIQHAIQNKKRMYDFLRGDEEYKFRLGGVPLPVMDIQTKNLTT